MVNVDEAIAISLSAMGTNFKINTEFWYQGSYIGADTITISKATVGVTPAGWRGAWPAAVTAYCSANSITNPSTMWVGFDGEPLSITAQAHINPGATNATTNLATNFNALSALLGLANGLNDSNTAQNDLATKYNDLATRFNSLLTHLETVNIQIP